MTALKNMPIGFPGLFGDWTINPNPVAIQIGNGIYWYGIILAAALFAGVVLCMRDSKRHGLTNNHVNDMVCVLVPFGILGARMYFVIFNLNLYHTAEKGLNWRHIISVWDGGLAIYGGIIFGFFGILIYTHFKRLPLGAMTDLAVKGLLLAQVIGRWGNFINREAFGSATMLPWRMQLWVNQVRTIEVHPTFLYESLWNLLGLILVLLIVDKGRRFDGENTCFYLLWYGLGRFWIEGLREDSLYLFDWTLLGQPIRVSQALSAVLAVLGACLLFYNIRMKKASADGLLVNRMEAEALVEVEIGEDDQKTSERTENEDMPLNEAVLQTMCQKRCQEGTSVVQEMQTTSSK